MRDPSHKPHALTPVAKCIAAVSDAAGLVAQLIQYRFGDDVGAFTALALDKNAVYACGQYMLAAATSAPAPYRVVMRSVSPVALYYEMQGTSVRLIMF